MHRAFFNRFSGVANQEATKRKKMAIEIVTKEDLKSVENRLNQVINWLHSKESQTNGIYITAELARKLKVSARTIQEWRSKRLLEYRKIKRKIYYYENAVVDFLDSYTIKRSITLCKK